MSTPARTAAMESPWNQEGARSRETVREPASANCRHSRLSDRLAADGDIHPDLHNSKSTSWRRSLPPRVIERSQIEVVPHLERVTKPPGSNIKGSGLRRALGTGCALLPERPPRPEGRPPAARRPQRAGGHRLRAPHRHPVGEAAPRPAPPAGRGERHRLGPVLARPKRGELTGPNPTDRGKPGSKRHVLVDAGGIPLAFVLTSANVHDSPWSTPCRRSGNAWPAAPAPGQAARRQGLRLSPRPPRLPEARHRPAHRAARVESESAQAGTGGWWNEPSPGPPASAGSPSATSGGPTSSRLSITSPPPLSGSGSPRDGPARLF
jgi:hypothetical protein